MAGYSMIVTTIFLCGLLGHTNSQGDLPGMNKISNQSLNVQDLNDLRGTDLSNLNVTAIQTLEGAKNLFKQSCDENGGKDAFEKINQTMDAMKECFENFVDMAKLQREIKIYDATGDLDQLFEKYCRKTPFLSKCVRNFMEAIDPCLDRKGKENMKIIQNLTNSFLNFVCFKEGFRIAMFVSDNGPQCLQSKQQKIHQCMNTTYESYIPALGPNNGSLAGLVKLLPLFFGTKECTHITTFHICVVNILEECSDTMPARFVDSIFQFMSRVTPCQVLLTNRNATSTSIILSYLISKL